MPDAIQETRALLLSHAMRYPQAEVQDYMKFLFQSVFGCEHLICDASAAADYIRREAAGARPHTGETIEQLDGPYCRVHLDILKDGLSSETFAALFALSGEHHADGIFALEEKLTVLLSIADAGELPLDAQTLREGIARWQGMGFPAVHHSQAFRDAYAPAYRLMKTDYARYLRLFCAIDRCLAEGSRLTVVIDGMCSSGKTTLAALFEKVYGCTIFHMDDYFLRPEQRTAERYAEPGGNVDRERFYEEITLPLQKGEIVRFRRFDCQSWALQDPVTITPTPLTVIEGSYSLHPYLRSPGQISVFLQIDPEQQMHRIINRNGERAAKMFAERWIPLEQKYFDAFRPQENCDFVFNV